MLHSNVRLRRSLTDSGTSLWINRAKIGNELVHAKSNAGRQWDYAGYVGIDSLRGSTYCSQ
jgi:hypothetical protein